MEYKIVDNVPIEGLRRVMANSKYGLINLSNDFVCETIYDSIDLEALTTDEKAQPDKRIGVSLNGLRGFINTNGKQVITPQFQMAERFNNRYAKVYFTRKMEPFDRDYRDLIDRAGNTLGISNGTRFCDSIYLYGSRQQYVLVSGWTPFSNSLIFWWNFLDLENKWRDTPEFVRKIVNSCKPPIEFRPESSTCIKILSEAKDFLVNVESETIIEVRNIPLIQRLKRKINDRKAWG